MIKIVVFVQKICKKKQSSNLKYQEELSKPFIQKIDMKKSKKANSKENITDVQALKSIYPAAYGFNDSKSSCFKKNY